MSLTKNHYYSILSEAPSFINTADGRTVGNGRNWATMFWEIVMMETLALVLVLVALALVLTGSGLVLFTDVKGRVIAALFMFVAAWLLACEIALQIAYSIPWEEGVPEDGFWNWFYSLIIRLHASSTIVLWIFCLVLLVGLVFSLIPSFKVNVTTGVEATDSDHPAGYQWREAVLLCIGLIALFALSMNLMHRDRNPDLIELAKAAKKAGLLAKSYPFELHFNGKMYDKNPLEKAKLIEVLKKEYLENHEHDPAAGKLVVDRIASLSYFSSDGKKFTHQVVVFCGKIEGSPAPDAEVVAVKDGSCSLPIGMDDAETSKKARELIDHIRQRASVPTNPPGLLPFGMKGKGTAKFIMPPTF